jgi:peroxiredoxin
MERRPMIARQAAEKAPDFEAVDASGKKIRLADYAGKSNIVLVLNRGFA